MYSLSKIKQNLSFLLQREALVFPLIKCVSAAHGLF